MRHSKRATTITNNSRTIIAPGYNTLFKTYELFISGISHLVFSDLRWTQVTKTTKDKTLVKGRHCSANVYVMRKNIH
jgi:hypothetical protein